MSFILNLSLSLLIPLSTGYAFLLWLDQKYAIPPSLKIALAYGLGLGLLAIWMLCLGILQQNFNLFSIGMPLIVVTSILTMHSLKRKKQIKITKALVLSNKSTSQHGIMKILQNMFISLLIVFIALNTIYVFWRSMAIPISTWDAIATIAFKAKIFFFEQSLPSLDLLPHGAYPLFVPFIESWIAFNLGYWDDLLVKIIFPCALLSYLIIHYKFLAYFTDRTWALLGCTILLSSNFFIYHATISYRDFFLMYFNSITIMLLLFWNHSKSNLFLILAGLFAGFMTFTKLEGTGYLFIQTFLVIGLLWKNETLPLTGKLKKFIIFAIPSYLICLLFHIYKIYLGVAGMSGRMSLATADDYLVRFPVIVYDFFSNLFFSGNWNIVWSLLLISLLLHARKFQRSIEIKMLSLSLFLFFLTYFIFLTFTSALIDNTGLLSRIILHFFPISVLLIIFLNYPSEASQKKYL